VLAHRRGIPISLAVVLIVIARQNGLPAWGINYPGHFLVNIHGQLIDPLTLEIVDESQLQEGKHNASALAQLLQRTTPQGFVLRMLNNLKALQMNQQNWSGVLDLIDYQVVICHDEPALVATLEYERAQCWQQLGAFSVAAEAFERCAKQTLEPELARQASSRAQALRRRQEILH
jgi:regulator of sirC expression with transglutaminase-like and TPR domain